jgi:hypothetical protein
VDTRKIITTPASAEMMPDVGALPISRVGSRHRRGLAPIDVCYEPVRLIRRHGRGFSGGETVWTEWEAFFARLDAACTDEPREAACG